MQWNKIETLFENLPEEGTMNIVAAEFGEYGIDVIDFNSSAKKILDGKAMHIDSVVENPTNWLNLGELIAHLEGIERK